MILTDLARKVRPIIEQAAQKLPDETALEAVSLFLSWQEGKTYTAGQRVRYNGTPYAVLQNHTSQADWQPDVAVSLARLAARGWALYIISGDLLRLAEVAIVVSGSLILFM